ncbi:cytochrome P450 4V2-like [Dendronephthya gigantea]|uniref:cytochrome P450 4V2-like n=1 Tax=Dendronephthya gigantea TaxID=151771 RepID=UPI00106927CB|nr:cytochrome P450 4V2-like [Dendronephthya gigantea]
MLGIIAVVLILPILAGYLVWISWKRLTFCQILSPIPGPKSWPIVGNALQFDRTPQGFHEQLVKWAEEYYSNGYFCMWIGPKPYIVVFKAEYAEVILSNQKNITKNYGYKLMEPWLGTGLLTSTGNKWKSRRRLLTPAFHYHILEDYIPVYLTQSSTLISLLKEKAGKGEFDIAPYLRMFTLDVICEAAMGVKVNAQNDNNSKYASAVLSISELILERWRSPWLSTDAIYNLTSSGARQKAILETLHSYTNKVISDRIELRKLDKSKNEKTPPGVEPVKRPRKRNNFLDLLLDECDVGNITIEGVREEVDTFMFEGHDTTASSLQWAVHMIGRHPQIQTQLQNEVDKFYDTHGDEVVSVSQLKELQYLECAIKETLRCLPSVPLIGREITDDCEFGPHSIPKGCAIVLLMKPIHQDPNVWDEPKTFNPDRFLLDNVTEKNPFSYIPFSGGPRNCIGQRFAMMEEKVVLSSILRHFNIKSTQITDNIKVTADAILSSVEGILVELEPRNAF